METFVFHLMPYRDSSAPAWPFAEDAWDPKRGSRYYREYLGQLEYAAELGYDGLGFNEHHFSTYGMQPSPLITASYMAQRTQDVTLAFFGNIIPIRGNPIRLAEELAMLDNLSEGRVVSGFPRGIPAEYLATNVDYTESRSRFAEGMDLILEAWTADAPFDWTGEHYNFENVNIWPRPYQDPHPPLWMPAQSDASLRYAAERRIPIGTSGRYASDIQDTFDRYRTFASEAGWSPTADDFTVIRRIYVAETAEQAHAEAREHMEYHERQLYGGVHRGVAARQMGDDTFDPDRREAYRASMPPIAQESIEFEYDDVHEWDSILVGDPAYVIEELERQYEATGGFGTLVGGFHFGSLPDDLTRKNLRLFAEEVLPTISRLG